MVTFSLVLKIDKYGNKNIHIVILVKWD